MRHTAIALILTVAVSVCEGQSIQSSYAGIRRLRALDRQGRLTSAGRLELGLAYYTAGQHLLFRRMMDEVIAADPAGASAYFFLGRHYASDVSDYAKASQYFRAAVERRVTAEHQSYLAHSIEMLGDKEQALALYRKAAALDRCDTVALAGLARLNAIDTARIEACKPSHPVVLRELAKMLSARGRHAEAARYLERVLAQEPAASNAYQLHRAWRAAGDEAKARISLEEFRRLSAIYGGQ